MNVPCTLTNTLSNSFRTITNIAFLLFFLSQFQPLSSHAHLWNCQYVKNSYFSKSLLCIQLRRMEFQVNTIITFSLLQKSYNSQNTYCRDGPKIALSSVTFAHQLWTRIYLLGLNWFKCFLLAWESITQPSFLEYTIGLIFPFFLWDWLFRCSNIYHFSW